MVTVRSFRSSSDALQALRRLEAQGVDAVILHPDLERRRTELRVSANDVDDAMTIVQSDLSDSGPNVRVTGWDILRGMVTISVLCSIVALILHATGGHFGVTAASTALILLFGAVLGGLGWGHKDDLYYAYLQKPKRERIAEHAARIAFLRDAQFSDAKDEAAGVIAQDATRCIVEVSWGDRRPPDRVFYSVADATAEAKPTRMDEVLERWGVRYER